MFQTSREQYAIINIFVFRDKKEQKTWVWIEPLRVAKNKQKQTRAEKISTDFSHPGHKLLQLLPSGCC